MLDQLKQAKAAHKERGRKLGHKFIRGVGLASVFLAPGLEALPDNVCVLKGGLAVIFSVRVFLGRCRDGNPN